MNPSLPHIPMQVLSYFFDFLYMLHINICTLYILYAYSNASIFVYAYICAISGEWQQVGRQGRRVVKHTPSPPLNRDAGTFYIRYYRYIYIYIYISYVYVYVYVHVYVICMYMCMCMCMCMCICVIYIYVCICT